MAPCRAVTLRGSDAGCHALYTNKWSRSPGHSIFQFSSHLIIFLCRTSTGHHRLLQSPPHPRASDLFCRCTGFQTAAPAPTHPWRPSNVLWSLTAPLHPQTPGVPPTKLRFYPASSVLLLPPGLASTNMSLGHLPSSKFTLVIVHRTAPTPPENRGLPFSLDASKADRDISTHADSSAPGYSALAGTDQVPGRLFSFLTASSAPTVSPLELPV